ncbi:MAG TPA: macro domain-containing protein [Polyangia bacterium]|nr:macro domain-containing protein [Polyangia bacterium]
MTRVVGDLLDLALQGRFDVIVHGANCQCVMSAGIAKSIRALFPEAYEADLATRKGDRAKLGSISAAEVSRGPVRFHVVNAYTQFDYGGAGTRVDYEAVRSAMRLVKERFHGRRIGYPKIGAGLGRGDWARLSQIIDEELGDEDHALVELAA